MFDATEWGLRIRESGLKVTSRRLLLLQVLSEHPHSTAEEIFRRCQGEITLQGVYLNLSELTRVGLLRRVEISEQVTRYELDYSDNHHHLVCLYCGQIVDVDCAIGQAPCMQPVDQKGFHLEAAYVEYRGKCAKCQLEGK